MSAVTPEAALNNAARILTTAETETDRQLVELYVSIADGWVAIAQTLISQAVG